MKLSLKEEVIYAYYSVKWAVISKFRRAKTFMRMLLTNERRLYFLTVTSELVVVTAWNYHRVKLEDANGEWAFIEYTNLRGEKSWCKAERF